MDAPAVTQQAHAAGPDIFAPDIVMLILTWVTFLTLLFVLQKFAWKPILSTLQKREDMIRTSLDQAERVQAEYDSIQTSKEKILAEAQRSAQDIVNQSRSRAQEVARTIEERAKEHAQEILESAHQQIEGERERVKTALRRESANVAVGLAGKIMKENVDNEKNRKLIDQVIKEI